MKKVLVLCTGNSCRSQMAEGYLRKFSAGRFEVYSAGIETHGLNARAIAVMKEDGIDISGHTSDLISAYTEIDFDYVITVCDHARERCPFFPATVQQLHHNFTDPARAMGTEEDIMNSFRMVRDQIKDYCHDFVGRYI